MDYDFIIIGGGIGGLQMAALCSQLGKVGLFEKSSQLGGRARVIKKNGFLLDWGPHPIRFGKKSAIALTLKEVGIKDMVYINPGLMNAYLKNGEKHIFPSGIKGILKTKMVPKLKLVSVILDLYKRLNKNSDAFYGMTFNQYFKENDLDDRIKIFLHMATASMMVNPYLNRSSIGEFTENMMEILKKKSVFYPEGGWNKIFNGLQESIEKNDGEIHLNTEVKEIIIKNSQAVGIKIEDKEVFAKTIINTTPIQSLEAIIDQKNRLESKEFFEKCKNLRPTAGISIDFCLSQKISNETLMFLEEPPSFGIIASNMSPEVAPNGKSLMSFYMPLDIKIMKDKFKRKTYFDVFRNKIMEIYPKMAEVIEFERPLFLEMVDGIEIAVDQNRLNRPKPEEINIKNLYLAGDSIGGEGAGGDIGHMSARECYARILKNRNTI